ncbi:MAG: hypothetical protein WC823_03480 [Parcubacteria group bacterium]|jgi:hypothetical protein
MKNKIIFVIMLIWGICFYGNATQAYQTQIVLGAKSVQVDSPETTNTFYGELVGQENIFSVTGQKDFALYVNILTPDTFGSRKDFLIEISQDGKVLASLDGVNFQWKNFYESFAGDNYWKGPDYNSPVSAGTYRIRVTNPGNAGKYALVIGKTPSASMDVTLRSILLIPQIKTYFFGESLFSAYCNQITILAMIGLMSLIGMGVILIMLYYHKKESS